MNAHPIWLVTNPASGSNTPEAVEALSSTLAPVRTFCFPDEPLPTRAELEAAGVATLAIFTGDGTINSAACLLEGWGGALLVLPGGTQNLLSKRLHGDRPAEAIVADAIMTEGGSATCVRRRGIRTSQGMSLIEVLAGPGALWADVRESVRDLDLGGLAETLSTALHETRQGPAVHLADLPQGKAEGYRAILIAPEGPDVLVEGYDFADFGELAAQGFAMLVKRNFREGPHEDIGVFARVTVTSDAPIPLMIDGELRQGTRRETFACEELALDFLSTRPARD